MSDPRMDVGFSGRALSNLCPIGLCANAGGAGSLGGEIVCCAIGALELGARLILYIPTKHENPKVCSALHIINNEYFSIRQCLDQLVEEANHKTN